MTFSHWEKLVLSFHQKAERHQNIWKKGGRIMSPEKEEEQIKDLYDSEFITLMELSWRTGKSKEELLRILTFDFDTTEEKEKKND
tara:strand:- start:592 stop:846 length:255 start_codon:yes stop_codon:yes gene_type:complete